MIFPDLNVAENIFISHQDRGAVVNWRQMFREAEADPRRAWASRSTCAARRAGLTLAAQQSVEIAKAISLNVRVLIMDEPTASLSAHEVAPALQAGARPARPGRRHPLCQPPHGGSVRDRRQGHGLPRRPADLDPAARRGRPAERDRRHGRPRDRACCSRAPRRRGANCCCRSAAWAATGVFEDVNFDVHRGEVLGFAGLIGAGRTDIGLALFGIEPATAGTIVLDGKTDHHPLAARRRWPSASPMSPRTGASSA